MKAEQNRLLGLLGIARRGGKITSGFDAVKELINDKKDVLVLLAMDLSAKTEKELRYAAGENKEIFKIPFTKDEVGKAIGSAKPVGVLAIEEKGLAETARRLCMGYEGIRRGKSDNASKISCQ